MSSMAEKLKNHRPSPGNEDLEKRGTLPDLKSIRKGLHSENCVTKRGASCTFGGRKKQMHSDMERSLPEEVR